MSLLVNGYPTSKAFVEFRHLNSWVGYCEFVDKQELSGAISIEFDGTTLTGNVDAIKTFAETTNLWFSSHPIKTICKPVSVTNASLKTLVGVACNPLGVQYECNILDTVKFWPIRQKSIASNLADYRVAVDASIVFRALDDGKVFVGRDEFSSVDESNFELMADTREENFFDLRFEKSTLRPGNSIFGSKVYCVRYNYQPSSSRCYAYV